MTVEEIIDVLMKLPAIEEVFIRSLDSDGQPMIMLVNGISTDPDGLMIEAGEEITFEEGAGAP